MPVHHARCLDTAMTGARAVHRTARVLSVFMLGSVLACSDATPPVAPNAQPLAPGDSLLAGMTSNGVWRRTGYAVTGNVQITASAGVAQLVFSPDFSIANTPGPVVYVNTTNNPNTGQPLRVGALKSRQGAQQYAFQIPPGVRYTWVIIWCDPFNVPMAEAMILPTP